MSSKILLITILLLTIHSFVANAATEAKQQEIVKKSIIRSLLDEVDSNYLSREIMGNKKWESEKFYKNTNPIAGIYNLLNETSDFVPVGNHELVIDGDKVFSQTGVYIDDIPGKAVVVYDKKTIAIDTQKKKRFIDGDSRQFNNELLFSTQTPDEEEIIIFDCLIPSGFNCSTQTVALITTEQNQTTNIAKEETETVFDILKKYTFLKISSNS